MDIIMNDLIPAMVTVKVKTKDNTYELNFAINVTWDMTLVQMADKIAKEVENHEPKYIAHTINKISFKD